MALIHVFDGIENKTTYTFSGKIKDNIKNIDWSNCIILRSGYRVDGNYEIQPDDILYIRRTPAGPAAWITAGAIAFPFIFAGAMIIGTNIYNNIQKVNSLESSIKAAKSATSTVDQLPYIKGAKNQAATGQNFPFAIGKSLMTPYRLCPAHYTIAGAKGEQQFYNVVLEIAYNDILVEKVKLGETVIKDFTGTTTPQNDQYTFDAGTYYDENNLIEIRQTGDFEEAEFNKKIVSTELSEEIPHEHLDSDATEEEAEEIEEEWQAGVVQELATNAKAAEIIVLFDGLRKYEDDSWTSETVTLQPQWTNVNNPSETDWNDFTNGFNQNGTYSNTFTYTTRQQMRFIARQEFTAEQAYGNTMKVRVRRTTPKADSSAQDSVYILAVQTECYDAKKSTSSNLVTAAVLEENERDKCCRIGVRIAANSNTDGQLDAISVIETGVARTWNGSEWSSSKTATSNLAAWALEILTSDKHRPSKYNDSELDLASFGAWYEYCETQGFYADGVITQSTKKRTVLETLCNNGNAALVYNNFTGKMEVAIDNGRDYSVALLNSENIISISTSKEFKRKTTGKKVTYINAAEDYDADSVTFMKDGGSYDPETDTLTETALEYVTNYAHAYKIAWRQMAEEVAQPRIITVKAGLESAYYPLYSRVELQHQSLKIGIAHGVINALVWKNSYLKEIHLDGPVTFPATGACGVIINCVNDTGRGIVTLKVSGTGTTDVLTVETTLRNNAATIPSAGNILSFGKLDDNGEFTTVTSTMKITDAEETDNGYTLTLVDYNPDLYTYGTLPEYHSNLTKTPNGTTKTVESQREYLTQGETEANAAAAAQVAVDTVTKGTRFTSVYKLRPVEMSLEDIIQKMDDDAKNASASISMSADEILLQVESLDQQQRALIALTKEQVLAEVDDLGTELSGKIAVQAGAVTALVEGGGAAGQMSLSLNLPVMITADTRAQLVSASTEEEVAAVYALIDGTTYYGIKADATDEDVKTLWDAAVAADLIASQIVLSADQIQIAGKTIYTSSKTDAIETTANAASENASSAKTTAETAATDAATAKSTAESASTTAGSASTTAAAAKTAADTAAADASSAKSTAEATATSQTTLITAISEDATEGHTVIDGGYLKTALIDVENILVKEIKVKDKGVILSTNYNGTINKETGLITNYGTAGWALDNAGNSDFVNINATGGTFNKITAKNIQINTATITGTIVTGTKGGLCFVNSISGLYIDTTDLFNDLITKGLANSLLPWTATGIIKTNENGTIKVYHLLEMVFEAYTATINLFMCEIDETLNVNTKTITINGSTALDYYISICARF